MLTLKYITENSEDVIDRLAKKHFDGKAIIAQVIELDNARKGAQVQVDTASAELNSLSKEIGLLMKQGKQVEAAQAKEKTVELKETIKVLGDQQVDAEQKLNELLVQIPNLPHASVPAGKHAEDNLVERTGGAMPKLPSDALPHWDLAKKYDLID